MTKQFWLALAGLVICIGLGCGLLVYGLTPRPLDTVRPFQRTNSVIRTTTIARTLTAGAARTATPTPTVPNR